MMKRVRDDIKSNEKEEGVMTKGVNKKLGYFFQFFLERKSFNGDSG